MFYRVVNQPKQRNIAELPIPPAAATAAIPNSPGDRSENNLVTSIVPEAPIGCPLAKAPPFGLVLIFSSPDPKRHAIACDAYASIISTWLIFVFFNPEHFNVFSTAYIGAIPGNFGFAPMVAPDTNSSAFLPSGTFLQITTKEAASAEIAVFACVIEPNNLGARSQSLKLKFLV